MDTPWHRDYSREAVTSLYNDGELSCKWSFKEVLVLGMEGVTVWGFYRKRKEEEEEADWL